LAARLPT